MTGIENKPQVRSILTSSIDGYQEHRRVLLNLSTHIHHPSLYPLLQLPLLLSTHFRCRMSHLWLNSPLQMLIDHQSPHPECRPPPTYSTVSIVSRLAQLLSQCMGANCQNVSFVSSNCHFRLLLGCPTLTTEAAGNRCKLSARLRITSCFHTPSTAPTSTSSRTIPTIPILYASIHLFPTSNPTSTPTSICV